MHNSELKTAQTHLQRRSLTISRSDASLARSKKSGTHGVMGSRHLLSVRVTIKPGSIICRVDTYDQRHKRILCGSWIRLELEPQHREETGGFVPNCPRHRRRRDSKNIGEKTLAEGRPADQHPDRHLYFELYRSSARLRGFEEDLGLHGTQFATILAVYFIGYILMQVPSNMLLNYMRKPSLYLPGAMILWGLISALTGITKNFAGVLACRFFLGFVEAAFFPGALLLLSRWYKREELGLRTSILFCGLLLSIAFGALIASGILDTMEGVLGHAAWRWLFFIEGALTMAIAVLAIFILPDFPENSSRWLTPAEQALAIRRMQEDVALLPHHENVSEYDGLKMALKDWKVWWLAVTYAGILLSVAFNAYFPTLTATLGYNRTISLVLCAPPSILVTMLGFINARHSDYKKERFWHIAIPFMVAIIGYIIGMCTLNIAARYVGLFLVGQAPAGYICFLAWLSNSFPEHPAKRAVALGLTSGFAQLGAVGGSYIFPKNWGPSYRISFGISLGASGFVIAMCFIFRLHLASLNRKAQEEEEARGQKEPGYRYIL